MEKLAYIKEELSPTNAFEEYAEIIAAIDDDIDLAMEVAGVDTTAYDENDIALERCKKRKAVTENRYFDEDCFDDDEDLEDYLDDADEAIKGLNAYQRAGLWIENKGIDKPIGKFNEMMGRSPAAKASEKVCSKILAQRAKKKSKYKYNGTPTVDSYMDDFEEDDEFEFTMGELQESITDCMEACKGGYCKPDYDTASDKFILENDIDSEEDELDDAHAELAEDLISEDAAEEALFLMPLEDMVPDRYANATLDDALEAASAGIGAIFGIE